MGVSVFQRSNNFFKHLVDAFNSWQDNRIEFWSCDNILQHVLYCQHALLPMIIAIDHVIWCVVNLAAVDSMQIYIVLLHTIITYLIWRACFCRGWLKLLSCIIYKWKSYMSKNMKYVDGNGKYFALWYNDKKRKLDIHYK